MLGIGEIQVRVGQSPCPSDAWGVWVDPHSRKKLMMSALRTGSSVGLSEGQSSHSGGKSGEEVFFG